MRNAVLLAFLALALFTVMPAQAACDAEACDSRDGYYGGRFCQDADVYRNYRDYYCLGDCVFRESARKVEECSFACSSGACISCDVEACDAKDGYLDERYCKGNDAYRKYRDYSCSALDCIYNEREELVEECRSCSDGECISCDREACDLKDGYTGARFCKDGDVHRKYRDYSCATSECIFTESDKQVERCAGDCGSGECTPACDVEVCDAKDGYYGSRYCKNQNVYRRYRDYSCSGRSCSYSEEERRTELCSLGCNEGSCTTQGIPCPNKCDGDTWSYGGYLYYGSCKYNINNTIRCNELDAEYGDRFCMNNSVYIEFRDYYCTDGGCAYAPNNVFIEACSYCESGACRQPPLSEQEAASEIKEKIFEFNITSAVIEKTMLMPDTRLFSGFLFGSNSINFPERNATNISFRIAKTNKIAPLTLLADDDFIFSAVLGAGEYNIPIGRNARTAVTLRAESSGIVFWLPNAYDLANIQLYYKELGYDEHEFSLGAEYDNFASGSVSAQEGNAVLNGKSVGAISKSDLRRGINTITGTAESGIALRISYRG